MILYLRQDFAPQGSHGLPKGRLDKHYREGVMFITYSLLIASLKKATLQTVDDQNVDTSNGTADLPDPRQQGVLPGTRLFHVVEWLAGADRKGECLIILDECHKAKNLIAREGRSKYGLAVISVCANHTTIFFSLLSYCNKYALKLLGALNVTLQLFALVRFQAQTLC